MQTSKLCLVLLLLAGCSPLVSEPEEKPEPGAQGPRGLTGLQGPEGAPGKGLTGLHVVSVPGKGDSGLLAVTASCPEGEKVLSGGCRFGDNATPGEVEPRDSRPEGDSETGEPVAWVCSEVILQASGAVIEAYAVCAP